MKFDLVFSNPPYNKNIDVKILNEIVQFGEEFVVVHPSTWLLDAKGKSNHYNHLIKKCEGRLKSVELFNGNNIFDIQLFVPITITHIVPNSDTISVNFFDDDFEVSNVSDITKFGKNWIDLIKPFYIELKKYLDQNSNCWDHRYISDEYNDDKFYCQLADIRGTPNRSKSTNHMLLDDFYTMVQKDSDLNHGIRKQSIKTTFEFDSKYQVENFIEYLKTDFARFCLSIYKINAHLDSGEMSLIPYLDFNEKWNDQKLFEKFNVSEELQNYMKQFLPDFHGIRK